MSFKFDKEMKQNTDYEEDEFEFFNLNSEDDEDLQASQILNNDQNDKNNTKKNKFNFSLKKKSKEQGDFIVLDEVATQGDEFVILQDESDKVKLFKSKMRIIYTMLIFCFLTVLTYFLMSYQLINEDIKGTEHRLGSLSVVSRNYQPNLDELKVGDKIICENEKLNWLPFAVDYEKLTYKSRNGVIIFAIDEEGNTCKIESVNIDFIAR